MAATVIDNLPGGLLDLLLAADPGSGREDLRGGRAWAAGEALAAGADTATSAAWYYLARHTALLTLPDGSALPYNDPIDERPPWVPLPELPDRRSPAYPVCCALVRLCAGLRDLRGLLPPTAMTETSPMQLIAQNATAILEHARADLIPSWPALGPHLDLLTADLASRLLDTTTAQQSVAAAKAGFLQLGNVAGAAAAAVVAGDWLAAPYASPVTCGLSLGTPMGKDSGLAASTEEREQPRPLDAAGAAEAYDAAYAWYAEAGDARGLAHVIWRRAYLTLVTEEPGRALDTALAAADALTASGDDGSALAAKALVALAGLVDGRLPDPGMVARPVIDWATGPGSLSHAIGIGRMFARTAHRWTSAQVRPERALAAAAVADAVWAGLGRTGARSQALADQAQALTVLGARQAALIPLESAIDAGAAALRVPPDPADAGRWRVMLLAADGYNLANAVEDVEAMDRALRRLDLLAEPLRARSGQLSPDQAFMAGQFLGMVATPEQKVIGLVYRAQRAREEGDAAEAQLLFLAADDALAAVDQSEAGRLRAIVRAFERRLEEAAEVYRAWLADRLAEVHQDRATAVAPADMALARQRERQLRDQALMFSVRVGDLATAHAQLAALQNMADPWWAELGTVWEHLDVVGRLAEQEGDLDAAAGALAGAVAAVEQVRGELRRDDLRQAFGADRIVQQVYRNAARVELRRRGGAMAHQDLAAAESHGLECLRLLELARARALMDLLAAPDPGLPRDILDAWRGAGAEAALRRDRLAAALALDPPDPARVTARRTELEEAQWDLEQRQAALRAVNPRFWQLTASGTALSTEEIAALVRALPPRHCVLVYSIDRPDYLACGITRDGIVASVWSRQERRIELLCDDLVAACNGGGAWQKPADELSAILLDPLAAALDGALAVHVIASGPTLRVPFGVLTCQGRPLTELVVVSVLPSLSAYPLLTPTGRVGKALCVGDPEAMTYRETPDSLPRPLPALPGAAVEAAAVAQALHGTPLIGPGATEASTRAALPTAPVIHLATHGVLDPVAPLASAVMLADGGQLSVAELLSLRLDADLVVFSACETGTGRVAGGDELLGLGRSLIAAGARAAVVTLWPVNDQSAAVLMTRFQTLRAEGTPTGEALRGAVAWLRGLSPAQVAELFRELRSQIPAKLGPADDPVPAAVRAISTRPATHMTTPAHPMHWAPFVLIGL
jgi:CHAT domain-containing protein